MESEADGSTGQVAVVEVVERPPAQADASGLTLIRLLPGDADPVAEPHRTWDVLAEWRAAERSLAALSPDSPDWNEAHAQLVGLRARYHSLFSETAAAAVSPPRMALVGRPWFDRFESAGAATGIVAVAGGAEVPQSRADPET